MSKQKRRGLKYCWGLFFLWIAVLWCIQPINAKASDALGREYSKVSIGFAAKNAYQPESAFGHVFLIFHQDTIAPDDLVLEFVGRVDGFSDVVKTLTDEVSGHYLVQTYAEKRRQYDLEDRGLYFANLRFTKEEVAALMIEINQRVDKTYPYDFAKRNCAYYLADLLSMVESKMVAVKQTSIVQPVDVMRTAIDGRRLEVIFTPSSRELYLNHKSRLSSADRERFELFLKGYLPMFEGDALRNVVAAFLRYRIPREKETWRRQHYAHAQKQVYLTDQGVGEPTAYDEGMNGHFEVITGSRKLALGYRPQQENFFSQPADSSSYAYLDFLSTEITVDAKSIWLSSLNFLASKSMNLELGSARLLEFGYRDWREISIKAQKEVFATFGFGLSAGRERQFASIVPVVGVAVGSIEKKEAEIRLGVEITGEIRGSLGSLGLDIRQWLGTHLTPEKQYKLKVKHPFSRGLNIGYEQMWGPDNQPVQHQIKLIYSVR